jgi:hypothetical protein
LAVTVPPGVALTLNIPLLGLAMLGLNATAKVHRAPDASVVEQSLELIGNSCGLLLVMARAVVVPAVPVGLVTVNVCGALVAPTAVLAKAGGTAGVSNKDALAPIKLVESMPPGAAVTVTVPVAIPVPVVGLKVTAMVQLVFGASATPLHPSVAPNSPPGSEVVKAPAATPPVLVTTMLLEALCAP